MLVNGGKYIVLLATNRDGPVPGGYSPYNWDYKLCMVRLTIVV